MQQLDLFQPERVHRSVPQLIRTPDDVYRIEIRLTFAPDTQRSVAAVEVTHEHTRELVWWTLFPSFEGTTAAHALLEAYTEAQDQVRELEQPF